MTVKDLIETLEKLNPEFEIGLWDVEWGENIPINGVEISDTDDTLYLIN